MNGCLDDGQVNEQTNFDQLPCVLQVTPSRERGIYGDSEHSPKKQSRSIFRGEVLASIVLSLLEHILFSLSRKYNRKVSIAEAERGLPGVQ